MVFHCFPQLPTELRLKIWAFSLPSPREIGPLSWHSRNQSPSKSKRHSDPAALWTSAESREVALTHYTHRESGRLQCWERKDLIKYEAFFDFNRDILIIPDQREFRLLIIDNPDWHSIYPPFMNKDELAKVVHLKLGFYGINITSKIFGLCKDLGLLLPEFHAIHTICIQAPERHANRRKEKAVLEKAMEKAKMVFEEFAEEKKKEGLPWIMPTLSIEYTWPDDRLPW